MSETIRGLKAVREVLEDEGCTSHFEFIDEAIVDVERLVKALEEIERSDRRWTSRYAQDENDILEHATSGNVLVHGPEGRIARAALETYRSTKP